MELLVNILCFVIFVFLQSVFINGIKICFEKGMIFYEIGLWLDVHIKKEWIKKPIYKCIKCQSSFWGFITFWPFVIYCFGFDAIELYVFIFDIVILVPINWIIYKRL